MHEWIRFRAARRGRHAVVAAGLLASTLQPAIAAAQSPTTDARDTVHAQTQAPFFTRKDAYLAAGFAAATVLMFPLDKRAAQHLQDPSVQANRFFKDASRGVETIASPGAYFIGAGLYAVGRIGHFDRVADLGWHGSEAVLFADGVTWVLKGIAGRERPFLSNAKQPANFHPFKGFTGGNYASFPSGHSTTAFAAAAAVTNETTRWWPHSTWIVGPLMYGGATAVALSRMYHNRHWGSDVVLGAAIGTFSGRKVVQYAHGHPHNRLDRIMLRTSVVPDGNGGMMLVYSLP
ncbi:MAG TPA: phosphatase PAP2 family protein [Gemmatimonadaceae bacterium]|nr:phosphatase PAP2 family protein [Gemmatimonadaceae bacterium]